MQVNLAMELITIGNLVDPLFFIYLSVHYISIYFHVFLY